MKTNIVNLDKIEKYYIEALKQLIREAIKNDKEDKLLKKLNVRLLGCDSNVIDTLKKYHFYICETAEICIMKAYNAVKLLAITKDVELDEEDEIFLSMLDEFMIWDYKLISAANGLFNIDYVDSVAYQFPGDLLNVYNWSTIDDYKDTIIDLVIEMSVKYGFTGANKHILARCKQYINWDKFKENLQTNALELDDAEELLSK